MCHRCLRIFNEALFEKQVFGWVAAYGEFAEHHYISVLLNGTVIGFNDCRDVGFEVTQSEVQLRQSNSDRSHDYEARSTARSTAKSIWLGLSAPVQNRGSLCQCRATGIGQQGRHHIWICVGVWPPILNVSLAVASYLPRDSYGRAPV